MTKILLLLLSIATLSRAAETGAGQPRLGADSFFVVNNCSIYDQKPTLIRRFNGLVCHFFSDGSVAMGDGKTLFFFDRQMHMRWKKKLHNHHMLTASRDEKHLIVLSSKVHTQGTIKVRSDWIVKLDLKGHQEAGFDTFDLRFENGNTWFHGGGFRSTLWPYVWDGSHLSATHELSHVNSVYELASAKEPFCQGCWLVNEWATILVLAPDFSQVLWHLPPRARSATHVVHDVQALENGNLLWFQNAGLNSAEEEVSSLSEWNPRSNTRAWSYFADPGKAKVIPFNGSVQVLADGSYLFPGILGTDSNVNIVNRSGELLQQWHFPEAVQRVKLVELKTFLERNQAL